jgi:hypothetical protein
MLGNIRLVSAAWYTSIDFVYGYMQCVSKYWLQLAIKTVVHGVKKRDKNKKNLTDFILRNIKLYENNRHTSDYIIDTVVCGLIIAQLPFIEKQPINRPISTYVAVTKVLHTWSYTHYTVELKGA